MHGAIADAGFDGGLLRGRLACVGRFLIWAMADTGGQFNWFDASITDAIVQRDVRLDAVGEVMGADHPASGEGKACR